MEYETTTARTIDIAKNNYETEKNNFETEKNNFETEKNNFEVENNNFEVENNNFEVENNILRKHTNFLTSVHRSTSFAKEGQMRSCCGSGTATSALEAFQQLGRGDRCQVTWCRAIVQDVSKEIELG